MPVQNYLVEKEKKEAFNNPMIIHWAGYRKPQIYSDANYSEYFWKYARMSPFYEEIIYINIGSYANFLLGGLKNNKIKSYNIADFILSFVSDESQLSIIFLDVRIRIKKNFLPTNNIYYNKKDRIFSIYENSKYRRITILGIKITIKK